jgi:hypothetical protein
MSVKIKFTTHNEVTNALFKPVPIKSVFPKWYKELDTEQNNCPLNKVFSYYEGKPKRTAKACIPLRDYMSSGYLLVTQGDIVINSDVGEDNFSFYKTNYAMENPHPYKQLPLSTNGEPNKYIKFGNDWTITTPSGYSCLFYPPEMFFEDRFRVLPGIVDTDVYDNPVQFPSLLLKGGDFIIKAGTPLVCVFPFKRENYTHECVLEERRKRTKIEAYLYDAYLRIFHHKKHYD